MATMRANSTADGFLNLMHMVSGSPVPHLHVPIATRNTQDIDMIELATGSAGR